MLLELVQGDPVLLAEREQFPPVFLEGFFRVQEFPVNSLERFLYLKKADDACKDDATHPSHHEQRFLHRAIPNWVFVQKVRIPSVHDFWVSLFMAVFAPFCYDSRFIS